MTKFKVQSSKFKVKSFPLIISLFVVFGGFNLDLAQAVGLLIKPTSVSLTGSARQEIVGEFLVQNVEAQPALYKLSPDAFANQIRLDPADFQLEPNASQLVKARAKFGDPGRYQTDVSVIARPMGAGGLTLASGVKLPLTIEVGGWPLWVYFAGVVLLIIICLLIGFGVKWILTKQDKPAFALLLTAFGVGLRRGKRDKRDKQDKN